MTTMDVRGGNGGLGPGRALRPRAKVLPEHARSHNRSLVLQTLYRAGRLSRADIARETGLTRVTVSDLVAELLSEGLVIELGQREAARPGKPAVLLDINRSAHQIVGVDLSDHDRFRGAVMDLDGELLHSATIAVVGEVPLDRLWHAVPSYPTISEVWLRLLEAYGRPQK